MRAGASLQQKGALDGRGDITDHGLEIGRFQQEARIANLLVLADRMSCAVEMAVALSIAKTGLITFFRASRDWDEATRRQIQLVREGLVVACQDDLEVALKLYSCWSDMGNIGRVLANLVHANKESTGFVHGNNTTRETWRRGTSRSASWIERDAHARANASWERLRPRWQNVVQSWAWPEVWDQVGVRPLRLTEVFRHILSAARGRYPFSVCETIYRAAMGDTGSWRKRREREVMRVQKLEEIRKEEERLNALLAEVDAWHKAQRIRAYVQAVQDASVAKHGRMPAGSQSERWIPWALGHADRFDPLVASAACILDEKKEWEPSSCWQL